MPDESIKTTVLGPYCDRCLTPISTEVHWKYGTFVYCPANCGAEKLRFSSYDRLPEDAAKTVVVIWSKRRDEFSEIPPAS